MRIFKFNCVLLLLLVCIDTSVFAEDCSNGRYLNAIFQRVSVTKNIVYARKQQSNGQFIDLRYDVYQPEGDTFSKRPIMLLIHGGAYLKLLDQNSPDIVLISEYFAKRGYVCVSIDYRQETNFLSLLSEEAMVKAVGRALVDTKDAVDHLVLTYQAGNPYRIDTSRAIIGGVSAGGVSTMFISYLDSLQMLPANYQRWIIEAVGPDADNILRHKFDYVKPKAALSISGAILDTAWIVPNGIDLFLVHGSADPIVPYRYDHPLGIPMLPKLYGGKLQYPAAIQKGIRCEFDDWIGKGHVPFFNLDLGSILTLNLINFKLLDSTERRIANFCYPLMGCDNRVTTIKQNIVSTSLHLFPNPATSSFTIKMPEENRVHQWNLRLYDVSGREYYSTSINGNVEQYLVNPDIPPGFYLMTLSYIKDGEVFIYSGKVTLQNK